MNKEQHERMVELHQRSTVLAATVDMLNKFGTYVSAEPASPQEDQAEAALEEHITKLIKYRSELAGHMLMAMCAMLIDACEWEKVQEWISDQERVIQEKVDEIHADNSD